MSQHAAHCRLAWPWKAVIHGLTGLAFGVLLSVVLVALSGTGPMKRLERWGSDFGMRLYARVPAATRADTPTLGPPLAFVDVDREACIKYVGVQRATECDNPATPPPDFLAAVVEAVNRTDPKVVIVDFPLPERSDDAGQNVRLGRLKAALTQGSGPIMVIAQAPVRPTAAERYVRGSETSTFLGAMADGRLRLASFVTWTDRDGGDRVVRGYPAAVRFENADRPGKRPPFLPSAPFLAAMAATSPCGVAAADSLFYETGTPASDCRAEDAARQRYGHLLGRTNEDVGELLKKEIEGRIFFSLLSLAPVDGITRTDVGDTAEQDRLEAAYHGLLNRYELRKLVSRTDTEAAVSIHRDLLTGRIVVIGTSATEASDWHMSPLGPMSGPEIILNAARAFSEFAPLTTERGFWEKLEHKLSVTLVAAIVILLLGWFPAEWLHSAAAGRRWIKAQFLGAAAHIAFLFSVVVAIFVIASMNFRTISAEAGTDIDFLLPTLAVAFEGIVELCRALLDKVEAAVHWTLHRVTATPADV